MTEYNDARTINIERTAGESNGTSSATIVYDNPFGRYDDEFSINQKITIYAGGSANPTTKIFTGIIEDINFSGTGTRQRVEVSGRDYGAILQDIIAEPIIFKDQEVSDIVKAIMTQNVSTSLVTRNNINSTGTTVEKITFNNISVFDAIDQLAKIAGFYFFVDEDQDLHFIEKDTIDSAIYLNNTNITSADFRESDQELFNQVTVYGDRQLTGAKEIFETGTDNTGSIYELDAKPFNVGVALSGTSNTQIQPGGITNINDPATEDVQFLVDYQAKQVILTSGTTAGDNTVPTGSVIIIDYQRSTPLIKRVADATSISTYGPKQKNIIDRNIKDIEEATIKANTFLADHKDPKINGKIEANRIFNVNPGEVIHVDVPNQGQSNKSYGVYRVIYNLTPEKTISSNTTTVYLNRKIYNFTDTMKDQMLRLRELQSSEIDTSITSLQVGTGSIGVSGTYEAIITSIGSGFFFHLQNHNILNSPGAVLGPWQGGSVVFAS